MSKRLLLGELRWSSVTLADNRGPRARVDDVRRVEAIVRARLCRQGRSGARERGATARRRL